MPRRTLLHPIHVAAATGLAFAAILPSFQPAAAQPVELVSRPTDPAFFEGLGNGNSGGLGNCHFGDNGNLLVFSSLAFNLVADDGNAESDVFVHDIGADALELVSRTSAGEQADGLSGGPAISGDGRYVLFESRAANLGVTGSFQGFRHDRITGDTIPIGFDPGGTEFNAADPMDLSGDGRWAVFIADDQIWLRDIDLGSTELITEGIDAQPANSFATRPRISDDGNRVVYYSPASNLVAGDMNNERDIFLRDRSAGTTVRIEGVGGAEPDGESELARISADGQWVVFESSAANLVPQDQEGQRDIFLYDVENTTTIRISEDEFGSGGNAESRRPEISEDGRFVVFESEADNLVPGLSGIERRLFLYDRQFDVLVQVAADSAFPQGACVTALGNQGWIAYQATEHPLIAPQIRHLQLMLEPFTSSDPDRRTRGGVSTRVVSRSVPAQPVTVGTGDSLETALAFGGEFLAFRSNAGNLLDVSPGGTQIVRMNKATGQTEIASRGFDGEPAELAFPATQPSISASGNRIAFVSRSDALVPGDTNNLEDIFVRDLVLGQITRVSVSSSGDEANDDSSSPVISADGTAVAFRSGSSNLVVGDSNGEADIFVRQLGSGLTERVSLAVDGSESPEDSNDPEISGNGRFVVFSSRADLLNPGGPSGVDQVWLHDRQQDTTELISRRPDGQAGNGSSVHPKISGNGRWVVFRSQATDLDPEFTSPPGESIYLHDRQLGLTRLISLDAEGNPVPVDLNGGPKLAFDGSAVLFQRFTNPSGGGDNRRAGRGSDPEGTLYVHSIGEGSTRIVTPSTIDGQAPNADVVPAAIEAGGRIVYVESMASNLVEGMVTPYFDIYRIDLDRVFDDGFEP